MHVGLLRPRKLPARYCDTAFFLPFIFQFIIKTVRAVDVGQNDHPSTEGYGKKRKWLFHLHNQLRKDFSPIGLNPKLGAKNIFFRLINLLPHDLQLRIKSISVSKPSSHQQKARFKVTNSCESILILKRLSQLKFSLFGEFPLEQLHNFWSISPASKKLKGGHAIRT